MVTGLLNASSQWGVIISKVLIFFTGQIFTINLNEFTCFAKVLHMISTPLGSKHSCQVALKSKFVEFRKTSAISSIFIKISQLFLVKDLANRLFLLFVSLCKHIFMAKMDDLLQRRLGHTSSTLNFPKIFWVKAEIQQLPTKNF